MRTSAELDKLIPALIAARAEFKSFTKDTDNPYYKSRYTDFATLVDATQDALSKHGLTVLQGGGDVSMNPDVTTVETVLAHISGQFMSFQQTLPAHAEGKDGKVRLTAQTACIGNSYGRRYGWQGILALVADEDDDGNALSGVEKAQFPAYVPPAPPQTPPPSQSGAFTRVGSINLPQRPQAPSANNTMTVKGILVKAKVAQTKKKENYLQLEVIQPDESLVKLSAFKDKRYADGSTLFAMLQNAAATKTNVYLSTLPSGQYINLDFPMQIGTVEFDTLGPMINRHTSEPDFDSTDVQP